mgnify:CR=1 FL=1
MSRLVAAKLTFAVLLVLLPRGLSAVEPQSSTSEDDQIVRKASHIGRYDDGEMTWRSRYTIQNAPARGGGYVVRFTERLPESATVVETTPVDASPVERDGAIVGLSIPAFESARHRVGIVVRHRARLDRGFRPPLAGSTAPQRVALQNALFEPAPDSTLVEYPGYIAPEGSERRGRDGSGASFEAPPAETTQQLYFRPVQLDGASIRGRVTPESTHKLRAVGIIAGCMALLGLIGFGAYRWLEARANEEEADEILREHGVSVEDVL